MSDYGIAGGARTISADNDFQVMSSVLTLLLRLRQACVHLALTKKVSPIRWISRVSGYRYKLNELRCGS